MDVYGNPETIENLVFELCKSVTKADKETLHLIYKTAIKEVKINPNSNHIDTSVFENISKKLQVDGRQSSILEFAELCNTASKTNNPSVNSMMNLLGKLYNSSNTAAQVSITQMSHQTPTTDYSSYLGMPNEMSSLGGVSSNQSSGFHSNNITPSMNNSSQSRIPILSRSQSHGESLSRRNDGLGHQQNRMQTSKSTSGLAISGRNKTPPHHIYVTEDTLLRELLFVIQGIDGKHIVYDKSHDVYNVDPEMDITISTKQRILKIAENGWLYKKIAAYLRHNIDDKAIGPVGQGFCNSLTDEINKYFRLISILESQISKQSRMDVDLQSRISLSRFHLHLYDPHKQLRFMAALVDTTVSGKKWGGDLVSHVYNHTFHGDLEISGLFHRLLLGASTPVFTAIKKWIYDGVFNDPFKEFFIDVNNNVNFEKFWTKKYSLNCEMMPSFIDKSLAKKILVTGKSINFLHQVCDYQTKIRDLDRVKSSNTDDVRSMFSIDLHGCFQKMIDVAYKESSEMLLDTIKNKYLFIEHLQAIKNFLLLGKGDFITHLMDLLEVDLVKPASTLYLHKLTSTLDQAVRNTNACHEHPEVLKRLDIRLLEISPGDTGWDVFSLDYHSDDATRTIFNSECMLTYLRVFHFLWRIKRMEFVLCRLNHLQRIHNKLLKPLTECHSLMHKFHILAREMSYFVQNLQYYINFEVLECAWLDLEVKIDSAKDLDTIIASHESFVNVVVSKILLDPKSSSILTQLRTIFDLIIKFEDVQKNLFEISIAELKQRAKYENECSKRSEKGEWATNRTIEDIENARIAKFQDTLNSTVKSKVVVLSKSYQNMIFQFISMLDNHSDPSLRYLSYRLNFNEYYQR